MKLFIPTVFNNLDIDSEGFIYTTTGMIDYSAIYSGAMDARKVNTPVRRQNPSGDNVLKYNKDCGQPHG